MDVIFWQRIPLHHQAGAIEHFASLWQGNVYGIYDKGMLPERKAYGWKAAEMQGLSTFFLDEQENPAQFVEDFLAEHPNAIHVLEGFRGCLGIKLARDHLFRKGVEAKVGFISERPSDHGKYFKKLLLSILYRYILRQSAEQYKFGLPMGKIGVDCFARCGCPREILFPFMYQCYFEEPPLSFSPKPKEEGEDVNFLYIGNFSWHKGADLLEAATKCLPETGWKLSLVGGGGPLESQVLDWAERTPQVSYLGYWKPDKIVAGIAEYDVCLVPSRYDGWGMVTNEAIQGGIATIASTATGSRDLVEASGAGKVVPAGSAKKLAEAMEIAITDKKTLFQWKEQACNYVPRIQKEVVGQYLFDVIQYTCIDHNTPRPTAPWL